MHVKDKSCNRPEGLQHEYSPMSIPKVLEIIFFYRTTMVAALNYVLVLERIFKKESGEIAFDLISLFHVEIQELARSLTTTRAFVFPAKFYYQKIFETTS